MDGSMYIHNEYPVTFAASIFEGRLILDSILVFGDGRGKGYGSIVLKQMLDIIDHYGVEAECAPEPFGANKGLSKQQLIAWYKRHGFKTKKGYYDRLFYDGRDGTN
jgi:GNAT superfamily N-acetyltransferase